MDRVSIIIPTYGSNTDPCRAIDSVLRQTYKNVEVVVVDDNGKGTAQQIKNEELFSKYQNDSRVRYVVHSKNLGGSVARNTGVAHSSGKYLCFLDDDDEFVQRSKISLQMREQRKLDSSWAGTYSSLCVFQGDKRQVIKAKNSGYLLEEFIYGDMSIGTAAPIISRDAYDCVGGFDGSFVRHQDWEFFARIMDSYKMKAVPEAYYNRYYKMDVGKKTIDERLVYMKKYVTSMKKNIKSIPRDKLDKLMRRKYIPIGLSMIKEGRIRDAIGLFRKLKFTIADYCFVIKMTLSYYAAKFGK